jgi:alanyl-tRNA synthetase
MLGNFSFGDYFKHEATAWAWEFITDVIKLPLDRLWVSIYEGDEETADIWTKEVGVPAERIVRLGKEDNFWEIGAGPCGPCSEIYFDRGEDKGCGRPDCAVGCDCDRFVEFWNLVFSQYEGDGEGNYTLLEKPNIDTGMGLERLACILQGVDNLFEVDTVQNIMKHISSIAGVEYKKDEKTDISLRVITDHIRSTTFMVGDGILPQNEGRGYVLRRLLRRAARHGLLLGIEEPFLYKVCETVIKENLSAYPALNENRDYIIKIIKTEEERFQKTISAGMELLDAEIKKMEDAGKKVMSGKEAFRLYDTFGFPVDLIEEILSEKGLSLEEEEFTAAMKEQKERARNATAALGDHSWEDDVLQSVSGTEIFTGYEEMETETTIKAIVVGGELRDEIKNGEVGTIVLSKTPFYAEMGGQVGDRGVIEKTGASFMVSDCQKTKTGHIVHEGMALNSFKVGDKVKASVDKERRLSIMRNHTACHLLQAALRKVLGDHVHQAGSFVSEDVCRFDFTHFSAMTEKEIDAVEKLVNDMILDAVSVDVKEMSLDEAKETGAMALFGEKYGDRVRVCKAGEYSVELCGGTHIDSTAKIGLFKIIKESSVAAGVRRIEAVTGRNLLSLIKDREDLLKKTAESLKVNSTEDIPDKLTALNSQAKELSKELEKMQSKLAQMQSGDIKTEKVGEFNVGFNIYKGASVDVLRSMGDKIRDKDPLSVMLLLNVSEGKSNILVVCGKSAVEKGANAGKLVKAFAATVGGSGGGRPDSAMGGFTDSEGIEKKAAEFKNIVGEI